jgi:hypothetical protein
MAPEGFAEMPRGRFARAALGGCTRVAVLGGFVADGRVAVWPEDGVEAVSEAPPEEPPHPVSAMQASEKTISAAQGAS